MSNDDHEMEPKVLGRYRTVEPIGRGGMSTVHLARAEGPEGFARPVVIKRLLAETEQMDGSRGMFVREAQILSGIAHPGVVRVLDFGTDRGELVMVLDYVAGFDLGQWLRYRRRTERAVSAEVAIHVAATLLETLDHLGDHVRADGRRVSIVHRDVSPSNVLLDRDGNVLLTDFGIATAHGATLAFRTLRSSIKGKVPYMAPEQLGREHAPASPATDAYAVAVVLHEMLVGRNELYARDFIGMVEKVRTHALSPISAVRDDAPDELDLILARALSKDPSARFPSAGAFAAALRALVPDGRRALADALAHDFEALPAALDLPTLDARERAWRSAGDTARGEPTVPTHVPAPRSTTPAPRSTTPARASRPTLRRARRPVSAAPPTTTAGSDALPTIYEPSKLTTAMLEVHALETKILAPRPENPLVAALAQRRDPRGNARRARPSFSSLPSWTARAGGVVLAVAMALAAVLP